MHDTESMAHAEASEKRKAPKPLVYSDAMNMCLALTVPEHMYTPKMTMYMDVENAKELLKEFHMSHGMTQKNIDFITQRSEELYALIDFRRMTILNVGEHILGHLKRVFENYAHKIAWMHNEVNYNWKIEIFLNDGHSCLLLDFEKNEMLIKSHGMRKDFLALHFIRRTFKKHFPKNANGRSCGRIHKMSDCCDIKTLEFHSENAFRCMLDIERLFSAKGV